MRNVFISAFGAVLLAACWTASCTSLSSDCDLLVSCEKYATDGGGGARPMICQSTADCPKTTMCATWACEASVCKPTYSMSVISSQIYGDCHIMVCDGMGHKISIVDDTDVYDDGNECTNDLCNQGVPSNTPKQGATPCGMPGSGMVCDGKGKCIRCLGNNDCVNSPTTPNCSEGRCVVMTCINKILDGTETDVDCGSGACPPCADGLTCKAYTDCVTQVCTGTINNKICQKPNCGDSRLNSDETDIDCGGGCVDLGAPCDDGYHCKVAKDCKSGVCKTGLCQVPTCTDGVQNGMETTIDCGGSCPACVP